jgi:hypothetical protein
VIKNIYWSSYKLPVVLVRPQINLTVRDRFLKYTQIRNVMKNRLVRTVEYPGILFGEVSTNSVEDRGQRERGSWGGSPLVSGSAQFANE